MEDMVKSGTDVISTEIGNLEDGECYLISGDDGTGKTAMALQFLYDGIRRMEAGLYITDEKPTKLLSRAESLGMDLRTPLDNGLLCILELTENYVNLVEGHADTLALMDDLKVHVDRTDAKRLVIDRVGPLFNLNRSPQFLQAFASSFLNFICELPCTCMLIESADRGENGGWQRKMLERVAFGVFHLGWSGNCSTPSFTVKKMRKHRAGDRMGNSKSGVFEFVNGPFGASERSIPLSGGSPESIQGESGRESLPGAKSPGLQGTDCVKDSPAVIYDIQSGIFSLTLAQERRIIDTMSIAEELGAGFSLVIIKMRQGSGIDVCDQAEADDMIERARELIVSQCRDEDIIVRAGRGELILVLVGVDSGGVTDFMTGVENRMRDIRSEKVGITLNYNFGYASYPRDSARFHGIIEMALKKMSRSFQLIMN